MLRVGILLIAVALIAGMVGYVARPIEIRDWYDLNAIRDNLRGSYLLMNNLDSTTAGYEELASPTANQGKGWYPIGPFLPWAATTLRGFMGTFDGQGYKICDLFINRPDWPAQGDVGLFGEVGPGGIVKDIGVVNTVVTGGWDVGGLVGWNQGTVSNCYCTGNATGEGGIGGLVGDNWGTVSNSHSSANVTGNWDSGGLVGQNYGTVSDSYSTGSVAGNYTVGGLVGENSYGTVSNSFWDTETSGQATSPGGTGKTTAEMRSIATFSGAGWNITAVANPGTRNPSYIWNIVDDVTYPFLSWQS
jgi:hypothetical protein